MRAGFMRGEKGVTFMIGEAKKTPTPALRWFDFGGHRVPFAASDDGGEALYLAAPIPDALMHCVASGEQRTELCEQRIRWVANHGLPAGVSFPKADLTFMGVELTIPSGCSLLSPERIGCGAVSLDFRMGALPTKDRWAIVERLYLAAGLTIAKAEPRKCSLGAVAGEGRDFLLVGQQHSKTPVFVCTAGEGATGGQASCIGSSPAPGAKYPSPCDQAFGKLAL